MKRLLWLALVLLAPLTLWAQEAMPLDSMLFPPRLLQHISKVTISHSSIIVNNNITTVITLNDNGKPIKSVETTANGLQTTEYTYNNRGTLEKIAEYNGTKLVRHSEFKSDTYGNIISEERYWAYGPSAPPELAGATFFEYNSNGSLKHKVITSTAARDTMEADTYDEQGRIQETYWGRNHQWLYRTTYQWNANASEMIEQAFIDPGTPPVFVAVNRYKNGKQLLRAITSQTDTVLGKQTDTMRWAYDSAGHAIEVPLSIDAKMAIQYNKLGLPVIITYGNRDWPLADPCQEERYSYEFRK